MTLTIYINIILSAFTKDLKAFCWRQFLEIVKK